MVEKPVVWLGDSRKQIQRFPTEAKRVIGVALFDAQRGDKSPLAKPFKGVASGVFEIAVRYRTDAFRLVYAVQISNSLYVLHAFQKKSKIGIRTPKQEVDLIRQRYQQAVRLESEL